MLLGASAGSTSSGRRASVAPTRYYVSLGDSYAIGYQPGRGITDHGFPDQVVAKARARGYRLKLVNFGCGGATTASILEATTCPAPALNGAPYGGLPQAAAAENFLSAHRAQIALVTVSIGGNDVTACAVNPDPIGCVTQATATIKANLATLAAGLRTAVGPAVPIIGTTYPDVILGQWVRRPVNQNLARLSVVAFQALINPSLQAAYASAGGRFVDVTAAAGAYVPLTRTVNLKPYGRVPVAVARVCNLSYYCAVGDIHATTAGYAVIAALITAKLPRV